MTIDTLARMTQNEFSKIDEHFDAVDKRFDKVDNTLKTILDVVLDMPSKKVIERMGDKVQSFDARLTSVERKVK